MAEQPTKEHKPRGRPGRKAETPEQRIARLERDLADARRAVEEAEARRLSTVGRAVLAEADANATFMTELRRILRERITTKAGRADVAGLLGTGSNGNAATAASPAAS